MKKITFLTWGVLIMASCKVSNDETLVNETQQPFMVTNDASQLNARIKSRDEQINIRSIANGRLDEKINLTLISEISAPTVNGESVMATAISENDDHLVVSYNTAGDNYGGAAVIMKRNENRLEASSEVVFTEADVSHSIIFDNRLFLSGAIANNDKPAWVGSFDLNNGVIDPNVFNETNIGGFVATSLTANDNYVYATSGQGIEVNSGVYQLSPQDLTIQSQILMSDARWGMALGSDLFVQNGIPGKIEVLEEGVNARSIEASDSDRDSKASFDLVDEYIFIATGKNGVEMYQLDGQLVGRIVLPASESTDFTTNAVAVYGDMIFISNGTTIYVASFPDDESLIPEVLGELELGDFESVNHILFQDNYLFVAAGLGGVKVIELKREGKSDDQVLSKEGMELIFRNSEEPKRDRFASYVLDGDVNTFWHTEWVDRDPLPPHELWVDLGEKYELSAFRYLSRQLGNFNGTVKGFELYLSDNTEDWGDPIYVGEFKKTREEQEVVLEEVANGRYFRFLILSETNGNPWASCAEINFVGQPID